ncbi:sec1 family domain-containing protein [Anaeramoeba flamelloides]|uniref:Sec1 family domain-containing protein n=1 Tax=Anaeramoeba flamelloides TaxID=1746091 RepID=A0ABQ8YT53_9EUKA|nr:sec1 family domain-containing protein [Anaeramoeba flamelloides]
MDLQKLQKETIEKLLLLNQPKSKTTKTKFVNVKWKILIYDTRCQSMLLPLFKVQDLKDLGITLHFNIKSKRESIKDVPAIYFVAPTEENLSLIIEDFSNDLYDNYYLNFNPHIRKGSLQSLARSLVDLNMIDKVSSIYDQYLNFYTLRPKLFELGLTSTYYKLNTSVNQEEVEFLLEKIAKGIFGVFVTMGVIPIIRAQEGNAAEYIAQKVSQYFEQNLNPKNVNSQGGGSNNKLFLNPLNSLTGNFQRPVLILVDRQIDFNVLLHHSSTYQCLVYDTLKVESNRVGLRTKKDPNSKSKNEKENEENEIETKGIHEYEILPFGDGSWQNDPNEKKKWDVNWYDLSEDDPFWVENRTRHFPEVLETISNTTKEISEKQEYITSTNTLNLNKNNENENEMEKGQGQEQENTINSKLLKNSTLDMIEKIDIIPELQRLKSQQEKHTKLALYITSQLESRQLDEFYTNEIMVMKSEYTTSNEREEIIKLIKLKKGTANDKMRLLLIWYLSKAEISEEHLEKIKSVAIKNNCDISSLLHFIEMKKFSLNSTLNNNSSKGVFKTFGRMIGKGLDNMRPSNSGKILPITRIVSSIMEMKGEKNDSPNKSFLYLDPKVSSSFKNSSIPRNKTPYKEAIVFVVGGGNYLEFQNLHEYSQNQIPKKSIIYGTTDIINADQFLNQFNNQKK